MFKIIQEASKQLSLNHGFEFHMKTLMIVPFNNKKYNKTVTVTHVSPKKGREPGFGLKPHLVV